MLLIKLLFIFVTLIITITAATLDLPASFKKCDPKSPQFNECLKEASQIGLEQITNGLPQFGIASIDPLPIETLVIDQGGSLNLKLNYKNLKITGFKNSVTKTMSAQQDKLLYRLVVENPEINIVGDYTIDGQILLLPIQGKGKSTINIYDSKISITIYGESFMKDGESYMRIKKFKFEIIPKNVKLNFDNLFQNKELSDSMNIVLNENWQEIFKQTKSAYEDAFGEIFKDLMNKIMEKIPLNKLFLN